MNQHILLPASLLLLCGAAFADSRTGSFYAGLNQANYGIAANTNAEESPTHRGIETSASFNQQSLDNTGGYALESSAYLNKGIAGSQDIGSARLAAYRLIALSPDWLLRAGAQGDYYENGDFPTDSYGGLGAEATLGHVDAERAGTDIYLAYKQETHGQVADDQYDMERRTLRFTQYLPGKDKTYWSWYGTYQQNDASDANRDSATTVLGVQYNQWAIGPFTGQLGLQRLQDRYEQYQTTTSLASLSLSKPLTKGMSLQFSSNAGKYDAPPDAAVVDAAKAKDFYSVSAGIKWDF
jgi:hypothetical protein